MGIAQFDSEKVDSILKTASPRTLYFEGMGEKFEDVHSLETALELSGLDFEVEKYPLQFLADQVTTIDGAPAKVFVPYAFPEQFATVRKDTMKPLGVVGKNYQILQNREMFNFLDEIACGQGKFETAGSYGVRDAKSFICMSTEPMTILGDEFMPYINFLNSFDGSGTVQAFFTPVRLFCSNAIVRSIKKSHNRIVIKHCSTLQERLNVAKYVLLENSTYLEKLKAEAEKLAVTPFSKAAYEAMIREIFPIKTEDKDFIVARNVAQVEHLMNAYNQPDLGNFGETAWRAIQAVADAEGHPLQLRKAKTPMSFSNVMTAGLPLLNQVWDRMAEIQVA